MKIFVKAKPNSKEEKVERRGKTTFVISVKEPPVKGAANRAIAKKISEYFNIPISSVSLVSGFSQKNKTWKLDV